MTRTLRLTLAYDGTDLFGWQIQPDRPTVQGLLMHSCQRVLGERVKIVGASRTDAGVHALRQVASLATASAMAPAVLGRALNALLPAAIRVLDCREAPPGFDARRGARGKRYGYLIDRGGAADPFLRRYAWHAPYALEADAMAGALRLVRGKHDFSAFCAAAGRGRTPTCTVLSARLVLRKGRLGIVLSADRFLHHMVRNLVGSLVEVGRGAREPGWIGALLAARDRRLAGPTAPPRGLTLVRVVYPT
ncbi:MAG: tRNA pseudouridine(38-40) synthase TruA [Candidatus Rokubacteria bacterium]|nr:tRNA pseudouridine(38-40) synthase TruA [Candidatus Rokubacteria bacterium]